MSGGGGAGREVEGVLLYWVLTRYQPSVLRQTLLTVLVRCGVGGHAL